MTGASNHAARILACLQSLGVRVEAESGTGGRLRFSPQDRVPAELVGEMKAHKAELIREIRRRRGVDRLISEQLAELMWFEDPGVERGWAHPAYRREQDPFYGTKPPTPADTG